MTEDSKKTNASDIHSLKKLLNSQKDVFLALQKANMGISSHIHSLNQQVTFMLDNHEEVELLVKRIEVEYTKKTGLTRHLRVYTQTDFKNVLKLAKKINMKMRDFHPTYSVVLEANPEFKHKFNDKIIHLDHVAKFFETLDEIKRPIFLNLNYYIVAKISN